MPLFTNDVEIDTSTGPVPVTGPLTDAELRATPIPVSGPVTDAELRATPVPVEGPLTDAELRATPVPVSGTVSVSNFPGISTGTATVNRVATNNTTAAQLLAANASRTKVIISTELGTTYIKFGAAATSIDYTVVLTPNAVFEHSGYKGAITAIRAAGNGNVQVTEIQ